MAQSFYGGLRGESFDIVYNYKTYEELAQDFALPTGCKVEYGQYAVVEADGKIYKRVFGESPIQYIGAFVQQNSYSNTVENNIKLQIDTITSDTPTVTETIDNSAADGKTSIFDIRIPKMDLTFVGATLESASDNGYIQRWRLDGDVPKIGPIEIVKFSKEYYMEDIYDPMTEVVLYDLPEYIYIYTVTQGGKSRKYYMGEYESIDSLEYIDYNKDDETALGIRITYLNGTYKDCLFELPCLTEISVEDNNAIVYKLGNGDSNTIYINGLKDVQIDTDKNTLTLVKCVDGNEVVETPIQLSGVQKIEPIVNKEEVPIGFKIYYYNLEKPQEIYYETSEEQMPQMPLVGRDTTTMKEQFISSINGTIWFVVE